MSMSLIAFNLITTAALASAKVSDRPDQIGVFVGGQWGYIRRQASSVGYNL